MPRRNGHDDIPIKIGGWDGHFVYEKPKVKDGYELVKPTRGTLEKQQWQPGKKEVIHKGNEHSEQRRDSTTTTTMTTTTTTTTTECKQSKERHIQVEDANDPQHLDQYSQLRKNSNDHQYVSDASNANHEQQQRHQQCNSTDHNERHVSQHEYQESQQQQQQQQQHRTSGRNETDTLPAEWDGKFPDGYRNYRPSGDLNHSSTNNLYGHSTEPTVLPAQWDGKYPDGYRNYRPKPDQNRSSANNLYGFSTEPTILPTKWDGTFAKSNETYLVPERNQSKTNDYFAFDTTPTVLPTTWNGHFELDPNDVRLKQERNISDVRDYADHRNYVTRE